MTLKDIALNNLRRRKVKVLFLAFGMVFGVATVVTLFAITNAMQAEMVDSLNESGTRIIVVPKSNKLTFSYGGINVGSSVAYDVKKLPEDAAAKVEKLQGITVVAPKLLMASQVGNSRVALVGVDLQRELQAKKHWRINGELPRGMGQVAVGSQVASKLKKGLGQSISLEGKPLTITGVLEETGSEEDGLIFMDLASMQQLMAKPGEVSFLEVMAFAKTQVQDTQVNQLIDEIRTQLPQSKVTMVKKASEARKELVDRFANFSVVVTVMVVLIGALIVTTTMMSSVNERTREIGIFRAIGFRQSHIIKIILLEAGMISALSGVLGYLAGIGTAKLVAPLVAQLQATVGWNPLLGLVSLTMAIVVGIAASVFPAVKAARLDPSEALRFI